MKPRHASTLCTLFAFVTVFAAPAFADKHKKPCCPKCHAPCELKVSEGTETKHCWKTESKTVCIPRVRFSWRWPWDKHTGCQNTCDGSCGQQCCPPPRLGKSREVCVLIKHEYECPVCEYRWEPREACNTECTSLPQEVLATSATGALGIPTGSHRPPAEMAVPPAQTAARRVAASVSNNVAQPTDPPSQVQVNPLGAAYLRANNGDAAIRRIGATAVESSR